VSTLREIPARVDALNAFIATDGDIVHVIATADSLEHDCGWDDPDLALHRGDVQRVLLDLGFAPSGPWKRHGATLAAPWLGPCEEEIHMRQNATLWPNWSSPNGACNGR